MQQRSSLNSHSISVVIPAFNCRQFLSEAIDSVLLQTVQPKEIVVVDDGSTDGTAQICRAYQNKIRYFYQENRGASAARNRGILESRGDFVLFLDADDVLLPNSLELLFRSLVAPNCGMVALGLHQEIVEEAGSWENFKPPYRGAYLSAAMVRRGALEIVGLLDENMRIGEDIDWLFRAREQQIPITYLDQVVLLYRRHRGNTSLGQSHEGRAMLGACRGSLSRRRLLGGDRSLRIFGQR